MDLMFVLTQKLRALKPAVRKLNSEEQGSIHSKIEESKKPLYALQLENLKASSTEFLHAEKSQEDNVKKTKSRKRAVFETKVKNKLVKGRRQ